MEMSLLRKQNERQRKLISMQRTKNSTIMGDLEFYKGQTQANTISAKKQRGRSHAVPKSDQKDGKLIDITAE